MEAAEAAWNKGAAGRLWSGGKDWPSSRFSPGWAQQAYATGLPQPARWLPQSSSFLLFICGGASAVSDK